MPPVSRSVAWSAPFRSSLLSLLRMRRTISKRSDCLLRSRIEILLIPTSRNDSNWLERNFLLHSGILSSLHDRSRMHYIGFLPYYLAIIQSTAVCPVPSALCGSHAMPCSGSSTVHSPTIILPCDKVSDSTHRTPWHNPHCNST